MEPFGHALSGIALAQAVRPAEGRARYWAITGALCALAPDVDAITYLLGGPDLFHAYHQFYTHNLVVFAVVPPICAWFAKRFAPPGTPFLRVLAVVWGAWALHLLGDTIAYWPEKLFWPFSRDGIALHLIRRDFSFGIPAILLVGTAISFLDDVQKYRRAIAIGTLLAAVAYVLSGIGW